MDYRVILYASDGTAKGELFRVQNVQWSETLNGIGEAVITVDRSDPLAIPEYLTELPYVVVFTSIGNWGGIIKRDIRQTGEILEITCSSNERLLRNRVTIKKRNFLEATAGAIARQMLIDANGVAPTNVTLGDIYQGGFAHQTEIHHEDLLDLYQDLAGSDGQDFKVTWDRKLNWYSRLGADKPRVVLAEGRNVVRWPMYHYSQQRLVNYLYLVGAGTTYDDRLTSTAQDSDSQDLYGVWQDVKQFSRVETQGALDLRAGEMLDVVKVPERQVDLTVVNRPDGLWGDFIVGDSVRVILPSYHFGQGFDEMVRVVAREVSVQDETMRLIVRLEA